MTDREYCIELMKDIDTHNDFSFDGFTVEMDKFHLDNILNELDIEGMIILELQDDYLIVDFPEEDSVLEIRLIEGNRTAEYKSDCYWFECLLPNDFHKW